MEPLRGEDPRRIGRYTLVARLGSGGMGQVFLGFSPAGRPVAVKVVHPGLARDRSFLSRFRQEVAAARKVSGAYTAAVVDAGDGDPPWLATALVVGPSLADALEQLGPLPEVSVWRLAAGLAEALAEVHSCGLVHRDLKPSNVLLATDGPRVIDFGISRALDGTGVTGTGMLVGTPGFMSPEQASGEPVGPASDVFSFGGVVAFAATGSGPFGDDGTPVAMMYRVVHGEPALAGLPGVLPGLVARCLAKRPDERATVAELMEIITANLTPVTSATAFWPEALAEFIRSYQARFTADAPSWPATVTGPATPPATAPAMAGPAEPSGAANGHPATDVVAADGRTDGPATLTTERAAPTLPPPAVAPPAVAPPTVAPPARVPPWWRRRRGALVAGIGALAAAVLAVVVVLATSSSPVRLPHGTNPQPPGGFGAIPAESGAPHAGTLSFEQFGGPNWILPLPLLASFTTSDIQQFDYLMWRPLYWQDRGVSAAIDSTLSLARPPAWSDGDKTVTITLNPRYKWSDGRPVTAKDVAFAIDEIKAAVAESPQNWAYYSPGSFPDDLAGLSTPNPATVVLTLRSAVSPAWFYQDELAVIQPMPAHAWAKASAHGPLLDFTDPADAQKIWDYLSAASSAPATWTSDPLWQVVDGPYRLTSLTTSTGTYTMAANPAYGGPDSHKITALDAEVPGNGSDAAEFEALQAGTVDLGFVSSQYLPQLARLKSRGYNVFGYPEFGWTGADYNFKDSTGDFDHIVAQLYFRQAMAHLADQQGYIRTLMDGAGDPDYGPVPAVPASPYLPADARNDPYPFSVAAARNLLASHGWQVVQGGTDTCVRPGAGAGRCGSGIPAGTRLAFNLVYDATTLLTKQMDTALAAAARQAGISISLQASNFNDIQANDNDVSAPKNADKWAMEDDGGYTLGPYPTTFSEFNTAGVNNMGGYSDSLADKLISASVSGPDPAAVTSEAAYLTAQQPALFQPNNDQVYVWKNILSGPPDSFANLTQFYFTPELWYFTKS